MQTRNRAKSQKIFCAPHLTRKTGRRALRTNSVSSNQSQIKYIAHDIVFRKDKIQSKILEEKCKKTNQNLLSIDNNIRNSNLTSQNNINGILSYYQKISGKRREKIRSEQSSSISKEKTVYQQKRWFRDQSINKTKQIRKLMTINQNIQKDNKELNKTILLKDKQIKQLNRRISFLSKQIIEKGVLIEDLKRQNKKEKTIMDNQHNGNNQDQADLSQSLSSDKSGFINQQAKNPFKKLKQLKRFTLRDDNHVIVSSMLSNCGSEVSLAHSMQQFRSQKLNTSEIFAHKNNQQFRLTKASSLHYNPQQKYDGGIQLQYLKNYKAQMQERYNKVQKELFRSMEKIKGLEIQLTVAKKKYYQDIQSEKKNKFKQYSQLKENFNNLLSKYTDLLKEKRKRQISEKIRNRKLPSREFLEVDKQVRDFRVNKTIDMNMGRNVKLKQPHSDHQLLYFELSSDDN